MKYLNEQTIKKMKENSKKVINSYWLDSVKQNINNNGQKLHN